MVDFSVCVEMVYDDEPFHERVHRAASAGIDAIEFWDWREKDLDAIETAAAEAEAEIVACVAGGVLTDPEAANNTVKTIRESIETASKRGIPTLIATTGPDQDGLARALQHENIVKILSQVAPDAEDADVTIALEPLNTEVDHPDCYLASSEEGFEIINAVDSPNVTLLYDVYHQQVTEGNIIQTITENIESIGHIHIADVPGRHEPGTGELNYANVFEAIDDADYTGFVGCEFSPSKSPDEAIDNVLERN